MSNQSFLGRAVGPGSPRQSIAPSQVQPALPKGAGDSDFSLLPGNQAPSSPVVAPQSAKNVASAGALVGPPVVGNVGGPNAGNLGDLYAQNADNPSKLQSWKTAYSAFFPEGSA